MVCHEHTSLDPWSILLVGYSLICHLHIIRNMFWLGNPNLVLNYSMITFTPNPPSKRTSSIVFMLIYTWITTMWLFIATVVVPMLGTTYMVAFSFNTVVFIYVLLVFIFYHKYFFKFGIIFITCPRLRVLLISSIYLLISWKIIFIKMVLLGEVEGAFWSFVGCTFFVELAILPN